MELYYGWSENIINKHLWNMTNKIIKDTVNGIQKGRNRVHGPK